MAVQGSGSECLRQHGLPSLPLTGYALQGHKEPRKSYCPLPSGFVLWEGPATAGKLLASLQGELFIWARGSASPPSL